MEGGSEWGKQLKTIHIDTRQTQADRHTDRHTRTHTDTHTLIHTHTHTDTHTQRHTQSEENDLSYVMFIYTICDGDMLIGLVQCVSDYSMFMRRQLAEYCQTNGE